MSASKRQNKTESKTKGPSGDPQSQLELLLIYEDLPTGLRGKRALDHVLGHLDLMAAGKLRLWRIDALGDPLCREQAAWEAFAADIVMLSMHGNSRLPLPVEISLKQWFASRSTKPRAVVISLDLDAKPLAEANPSVTDLRSVASRSGGTVMLHFGEPERGGTGDAIADTARDVSAKSLALNRTSFQREPYSHWGINE